MSSLSSCKPFTAKTKISDVINDPAFEAFGRLIFPVNDEYFSGSTIGDIDLTWYNNINPNKTVEIVNFMKDRASSGEKFFFDIYSPEEKARDHSKNDTGLFFFKGNPGAKFAICNAGGGFAYVGAMHDSFPHALELSKRGYNAFALIYRPDSRLACMDLANAIKFVFDNSKSDLFNVDTSCYSLWGGSAGARMAANLGSHGTVAFSDFDLPRAGAVIMQYTGHSYCSKNDPPTYNCVGTSDYIANWRVMKDRIERLKQLGVDAEFHKYNGLSHGFGLGTGTIAEGWINDAIAFWEKQMKK